MTTDLAGPLFTSLFPLIVPGSNILSRGKGQVLNSSMERSKLKQHFIQFSVLLYYVSICVLSRHHSIIAATGIGSGLHLALGSDEYYDPALGEEKKSHFLMAGKTKGNGVSAQMRVCSSAMAKAVAKLNSREMCSTHSEVRRSASGHSLHLLSCHYSHQAERFA